ncbi:MAG: hypothetical protein ACI96W_002216 [Paraglaciecola sp.]|jgi:hypothetical protein
MHYCLMRSVFGSSRKNHNKSVMAVDMNLPLKITDQDDSLYFRESV